MKSSKKEMKKRLLALLLCITMVMNGGISTFAEGSEQSGHTHTEACYTNVETKELVCKVPEEEAHMHGPSCYTENKQLTCAIEASEGHVHTEKCVGVITEAVTGNVCQPEEGAEHTHTEECVGVISEEVTGNVCGLEESEGHAHGDECYTVSSELTCTVPETEGHKHVDECYHVIPAGTLVCTLAETADETQKGAPSDICKCGNPECTCETCEEGCTCETAEKEAKDTEVEDKKTEETENKEETKQPEKTEYSVEGGKTTPKVSITLADAAHIPDEAVLEVDSVTLTDEEAAAIEGAAKAEGIYSENVTALDICFELEVVDEETGETTLENPQPLDGNEVNVAVALPGIEADDEVSVYHLRYETVTDENGEEKEELKVEDMDASVNAETGAVEFKTPHFSTYVFVENADTAVAAIMEMLEDLPTVETVESELLAYAEAEDWDGYKEYYVEVGTAGKTVHDAYAALTDEEKANIENVEKLTALETIWSAEDLESAAEVAVVIAMIDQLPTYEEVAEALTKFEEEEDWEGYEKYTKDLAKKAWPAYYAYEALSEEQKILVTNYNRLMETSGVWSVVTLEEIVNMVHDPNNCKKHDSAMKELKSSNVTVSQNAPTMYMNKTVSDTSDPNEFELMLEAYVTGNEVNVPLDIVLVLDRSGSMGQANHYLEVDEPVPGYTYYNDKSKNYGLNGYASPITWCDDCQAWVKRYRNPDTGKTDTSKGTQGYQIVDPETTQFYETNMQATERSIRSFINQIIENGNKNNTNHRIAMLAYHENNYATLYHADGTKKYTKGGSLSADYVKKAFVELAASNANSKIETYVNTYATLTNMKNYGASTDTHVGLELADVVLAKKPTAEGDVVSRKEMVVLFADGAPGVGKTLDGSWAKEAIENAAKLKNRGVEVFTVGFYDSASSDPNNMEEPPYNIDTSTNYYKRSNYVFNAIASPGKFYPAQGAEALAAAFEGVFNELDKNSYSLNATTVLKEQISKYFVLDCGCSEDTHNCGLQVYTSDYVGKDANGNHQFSSTLVPIDSNVTMSVETIPATDTDPEMQAINVTGFDYEANAIIENNETPVGKKLVLKVPIETRAGFWGGNNVPTNHESTALYGLKEGSLVELKKFPMPEANVPMTVNVEAKDETIYYAGAVNATELLKGISAGYSEDEDDNWIAPTTPIMVNTDGTLTPQAEWMDDYATITWQSTSTKLDTLINNKDCGAYDYEVVMEAINNAEMAEVNQSGHPGANKAGGAIAGDAALVTVVENSKAKATGNVHILVPVLSFQDTEVPFGYEATKAEYDANNKLPEVIWVHKKAIDDLVTADKLDTLNETMLANLAADTSFDGDAEVDVTTKPTLSIDTYSPYQLIYSDTPVDVTALSYKDNSNVTSEELMSVATFMWKDCTSNLHNENKIFAHKASNGYEFWLHTYEIYELPSTGGIGTYWYTLGGVVLMMSTSLMLYKRKREEVLGSK